MIKVTYDFYDQQAVWATKVACDELQMALILLKKTFLKSGKLSSLWFNQNKIDKCMLAPIITLMIFNLPNWWQAKFLKVKPLAIVNVSNQTSYILYQYIFDCGFAIFTFYGKLRYLDR